MEINIGDKVRFLNATGGGKVTGFQKGNLVLVEDEDGFEVPMLMSEVVVVASEGRTISDFLKKPEATREVQPTTKIETVVTKPSFDVPVNSPTVQKTTVQKTTEDASESLEERVLRLEITVKKLMRRIERLEDAKALREKIKQSGLEAKEQQRILKNQPMEVDLHIDELVDTTAGMSATAIKEHQLQVFNNTMQENLKYKGRKIVFIHGNGDGVLRKALINELNRKYKQCEYQDASFQQYGFGATMVIIH